MDLKKLVNQFHERPGRFRLSERDKVASGCASLHGKITYGWVLVWFIYDRLFILAIYLPSEGTTFRRYLRRLKKDFGPLLGIQARYRLSRSISSRDSNA